MTKEAFENRYQRQISLPLFGDSGQLKLAQTKVLVIGAGGLGCPALQYMAAAGFGTIGIVDNDVVSVTNLQRQILYTENDLSKPKVEVAKERLNALNSEVHVVTWQTYITTDNAIEIIEPYDVILDCTDNFESRYLINDACVLLNKPLVYAAVLKFEGQAGVFNYQNTESDPGVSYRDLFPNPTDAAHSVSCNEAGVLGVLPGIMGVIQAAEAIKISTGIGKVLRNKLLIYNALTNEFNEFTIAENELSPKNSPKTITEFKAYSYELFCNTNFQNEITFSELKNKLQQPHTIIDVRNPGEQPAIKNSKTIPIPLNQLQQELQKVTLEKQVIFICQSGKRSLQAVELVKNIFPEHQFFSLKGGVNENFDHLIQELS